MMSLKTLSERPHWIVWKLVDRDGVPTKVPCLGAKSNDPKSWGTFEKAKNLKPHVINGDVVGGVGLMLGQSGSEWIAGIDLDSCRDPDGGEVEPWAAEIVKRFESYTEVSPSGTGLKIFFLINAADVIEIRKSLNMTHGRIWKREGNGKAHPAGIEFYISHRFFAVTGNRYEEAPAELRCAAMSALRWLVRTAGPALRGHAHTAHAGRAETSAQPDSGAARPRDMSRSAVAFRLARQCRDEGKTYAEYVELLQADPATAAWWRDKGQLNGERETKRAWEHAAARPPACVDEEQKVEIILRVGHLDELATEAETAIVVSGLSLFQRGKTLVHPYVFKSRAAPLGGRDRETMFTGMQELSEPRLVDYLCRVAVWLRYNGRKEDPELVRCNPPPIVAKILLKRVGEWRLPVINSIITTPTLRPDGSLLDTPGFDVATGLFFEPDPNLQMPAMQMHPTREDALAALELLRELLAGFPFVTRADESVALSGIITPIVRTMFAVAPLHTFVAHTPGTGKSYLADLCGTIALGNPCPATAVGRTEGETEKRLDSLLLEGAPMILLDNVNGELGGDKLCMAVERPWLSVRQLGVSKSHLIRNNVTMYATGNSLRTRGDMVRRTLRALMDAKMERPETRKFEFEPVARVMADRGRYVAAVLTIVRAFLANGADLGLMPLQSYEDWSRAVRSPLVWLECADPCETMEEVRAEDPVLGMLRQLLSAWRRATTEPKTAPELAEFATKYDALNLSGDEMKRREALRTALVIVAPSTRNGAPINERQLGYKLRGLQGRIACCGELGNLRLEKEESRSGEGLTRWRVVATEEAEQPGP